MVAVVYIKDAIYKNDTQYDYQIPVELEDVTRRGSRVTAPYAAGNRPREAVVTEVKQSSEYGRLKNLLSVLDAPLISDEMLELAGFIKRHCFCTFYDAIRTMLPPGAFVKFEEGRAFLHDFTKKQQVAALFDAALAEEYLQELPERYAAQRDVLGMLLEEGSMPVARLCEEADCSASAIKTLQKKGILTITEQEISRDPYSEMGKDELHGESLTPNAEQQQAVETITAAIESGKSGCILLKGVTGSGKTVVFIKAIKHALDSGKTALLMVPEIALTPQMVSIFYHHFGDLVTVMHSRMSVGERNDAYYAVLSGQKKIVIGTRLSVFAPLCNIGLIIMDEEQENTYKSEMTPRYDAKEIAKYRSVYHNSLLILASATPSVESFYKASKGTYGFLELKERYNGKSLPQVTIVDMTKELKKGNQSAFSEEMQQQLQQNLDCGEQSILFLNRRGYSSFLSCRECGEVIMCPNCSISLTYHFEQDMLRCHYCGYEERPPKECPSCGSSYLKYMGSGTEKVEQQLQSIFPTARILRMDTDTTAKKGTHQKLLGEFGRGEADILVGTQMVVKGLDFENVTFVGVVNADTSLYIEDFRAAQNTFNLITQVVGRCGRGEKQGRALIQTYHPESTVIQNGAKQDYESFYEEEIGLRRMMDYPPFCDICVVMLSGENEALVASTIISVANAMKTAFDGDETVKIVGPSPCRLTKIEGQYRYRVMMKCKNNQRVRAALSALQAQIYEKKECRTLSISIDMNPYTLL